MNKKGQVILALILVMTVALAIGLSVIQKSLTDISTSTKVEQSSRAFSAAEAGIEKYLQNSIESINCTAVTCNVSFPDNSSEAKVEGGSLIPAVPAANTRQELLEYPPLSKEEIAHVWLADYQSTTGSTPPNCGPNIKCHYIQNSLDVYWGNSDQDKAALELTLVYYDGSKYASRKWYLDHQNASRISANNFDSVPCTGASLAGFQCHTTLQFTELQAAGQILIRARLLYNSSSQPLAVQAVGTCGADCSIPPQARILESTGTSGETQRKVSVFQLNKVVPPYFDYAIFSAGEISK